MATESKIRIMEQEMQKHLDKVFKLMRETVDMIKEVNIKKYDQKEFAEIVDAIHYAKVRNHYEVQKTEQEFKDTFKKTFVEVMNDKTQHN